MNNVWGFSFSLLVLAQVSTGFQWTSSATLPNNARIPSLVGEDVTLPWNYTLSTAETLVNVEWYYNPNDGTGEVSLGSLVNDHFMVETGVNQNIQYLGGGGIRLLSVDLSYSGSYSVRVNVIVNHYVRQETQSITLNVTVSTGFQWTSSATLPNNARISSFVGRDVTLPWNYRLNTAQTLVDVEWYYNPNDGTGEVFLGSLVNDHFMLETGVNQNIQYLGGGSIRLLSVDLSYIGSYTVRVNVIVNGQVRQEIQSITLDVTGLTGVQWTSSATLPNNARISSFVGQDVTLPWNYTLRPTAQTLVDVEWYYSAIDGRGEVFLGSLDNGHFLVETGVNQNIQYLGGGSIRLLSANLSYSGRYSIRVNVKVDGDVIQETQSIILDVTEKIRLVGGQTVREGRVEIYANGVWGTVCDDHWDNADAEVACRQLGYLPINATTFYDAYFGQGTGPIHMEVVNCHGDEHSLLDCPFERSDHSYCNHSRDAGVRCIDGIRLVGGQTVREGRVEIYANGRWGTVCDDYWDNADALVVCRQLGYLKINATTYSAAYFGQGNGYIHMDDVQCRGSEHRLLDCPFGGLDHTNCGHSKDAGVKCIDEIRLVGGQTEREGRVEINANGVWETVCDDSWDTADAEVVCRQLGFSSINATAYSNAYFGQGTGPIHMANVQCHRSERSLLDCPFGGIDQANCDHSKDAGVRCFDEIRLVGGQTTREGRVEIYANGVWGTVCGDWDNTDAKVVCRQLGFSSFNAAAYTHAYFGQGTGPIHIDNVRCFGSEDRLLDCPSGGFHHTNCDHSEDAGVRCFDEIRLVGGQTGSEGRVEIYANGRWGTVCDDGWDDADAEVVCRQLGYLPFNATAFRNAHFGQGSGYIHMDDVSCYGSERRLLDCPYGGFDHENCEHSEDAGVRCIAAIRLVDGSSPTEGRVEILVNGVWGTVCDDGINNLTARVVCRELGYSTRNPTVYSRAHFGEGSGPIYMDEVNCQGSERRLLECPFNGLGNNDCLHSEDMGVMCSSVNS